MLGAGKYCRLLVHLAHALLVLLTAHRTRASGDTLALLRAIAKSLARAGQLDEAILQPGFY